MNGVPSKSNVILSAAKNPVRVAKQQGQTNIYVAYETNLEHRNAGNDPVGPLFPVFLSSILIRYDFQSFPDWIHRSAQNDKLEAS